MATFLLDGKSTATLPKRPLAATLATSTGVRTGIRLHARYSEARGDDAPRVVQTSPTALILPTVDRAITLIAVPDDRAEFAEGTVLHLSIGLEDTRHGDGDRAQVAQRDVSGLKVIELATVAPGTGESLVVASKVGAVEIPLPELAGLARVAARGVVGPDPGPNSTGRRIRVVVDRSSSMAALHASGAIAAAGDIVAGIAAVIGDGDHVGVVEAGDPGGYPTAREVELGALGTEFAAGAGPGAFGASPSLTIDGQAGDFTVVITDGSGAALVAAEPRSGTVVLALTGARSIAARPGFAGALCPAPDRDARRALAQRPDVVRAVVAELLGAGRAVAAL